MKNKHKEFVENLLAHADVKINGDRPWDIHVHDERLYARVISGGSLALGESYMDGWWDCDALDELIARVMRAKLGKKISVGWNLLWRYVHARVANAGSAQHAFEIGEKHYDIGNDLFRAMLDKRLLYTCAYWTDAQGKEAASLDEAQEAKLDLICRKIGLKKGDKVLDIGCGWGGFCKFAAEKYGAQVVGITVSKEQKELVCELCKGLQVEIRLTDYRDVTETFDHIVSIGMFEHVGLKNYRTYMEVANRCLKDDGYFLLHTIGGNTSHMFTDPWLDTYIFPGSLIPSIAQMGKAIEGIFVMEDWHNFGVSYDKTLMAWHANFEKAWPALAPNYSPRFYRMWRYYLLVCAGLFRARECNLWQIVLSKKGTLGGYQSVR